MTEKYVAPVTAIRDKRLHFSKDAFVVLASVGAAVGLGNFWRFPLVAYANGGGSFLIPYVLVSVMLGLPIVVMEFALGRKTQKSIQGALCNLGQKSGLIGWAIGLNCFVIVSYYAVLLAWALLYLLAAPTLAWKGQESQFFTGCILQRSSGAWDFGGVNWMLALALGLIWLTIFWITSGNLRRVEKVLRVTVFLPVIVIFVLVWRAATLEGAGEGIHQYLHWEPEKLKDLSTWGAAISQVMMSLSVGMGQLVAYSARGSSRHVGRAGFTTTISDALFSFVAGFAVFATLGYMVHFGHGAWSSVEPGPGMAFIAYPTAIALLPNWARFFSVVFFIMLLSLGIDSAFAVIEANMLPFEEVSSKQRRNLSAWLCGIAFLFGVLYVTRAGLYWIDIVDHFVVNYGVLLAVLVECLLMGRKGRLEVLSEALGGTTWLVKTWKFAVRVFAPVSILAVVGQTLLDDICRPYAGYPKSALACGAIGVVTFITIGSLCLSWYANRLKARDLGYAATESK